MGKIIAVCFFDGQKETEKGNILKHREALVTLAGSFASCTGGNVADDTTASQETEAEEQTTLQEDETTLEETTTSDETAAEEETTAGNDEQNNPTGEWIFDLKEIVYEMTQNPQKKGSDVEDSLGG